jgi:hypothetical protein
MAGLRVGITVPSGIEDGVAALWASGVHQNAVFLCRLVSGLPNVAWAGLLTHPGPGPSRLAELFGLKSAGLAEALGDVDILIELGMRADKPVMQDFRARGGRLVSYMAGNAMVMNLESVANRTPHGEILDHAGYDAVWITPQHWHMNESYARLTRSANVQLVPHIWHPCVIDMLKLRTGARFEWSPPQGGWRLGIFEPNINVLKTFHLPLLVCEQAFRQAPDRIARVLMFGAEHLKATQHFDEFCGTLDICRAGRLFAESRHPLVSVLGQHVDAVVTHQWQNALNYLYWDALHGGFPLVHNSPHLKEAGYYYPAFDPVNGGRILAEALSGHEGQRDTYRERAIRAIANYHADNDLIRARHAALLEQL